jgi:hypothetical protein
MMFAGLTAVSATGLLAFATADSRPADHVAPLPAASDLAAPAQPGQTCDGHTIGYWTNMHGEEAIEAGNFLSVLPSLHVVDEVGAPFTTNDFDVFKDWMQGANAFNMAYMLSVQLVAMQFNVLAGYVDERCMLSTHNGEMTVNRLIEQSIEALIKDPYTPPGDPNRVRQEMLKDLLDAANNNLNWI